MDRFSGTTAKCKSCDKTVYMMDQLVADGIIYHKHCFRCNHCKRTLSINDYASLEGVVYCKPHFNQLFKKTGSYGKSFDEAIKAEKLTTTNPDSMTGAATRFSTTGEKKVSAFAARFQGTQEKCIVCGKTVYPIEKISVENAVYHNTCFKCFHGGCKLTLSTYAALDGKTYCRHHYSQIFKEKGNYSKFSKKDAAEPTPVPGATSQPEDSSKTESTPKLPTAAAPESSAGAAPAAAPESSAETTPAATPEPSNDAVPA